MTNEQVALVTRGIQNVWAHPTWAAVAPAVAEAAVRSLEDGGWRIVWGGPTWRPYRNHAVNGMVTHGDRVLAGQITWEAAAIRFPHVRKDPA